MMLEITHSGHACMPRGNKANELNDRFQKASALQNQSSFQVNLNRFSRKIFKTYSKLLEKIYFTITNIIEYVVNDE